MLHHALTVVLRLILQILGDHLIVIDNHRRRYPNLPRRIRQGQHIHDLVLKALFHLCLKIQTAQTVAGQSAHIVRHHLLHRLRINYGYILRKQPGNAVGNQVLDGPHFFRRQFTVGHQGQGNGPRTVGPLIVPHIVAVIRYVQRHYRILNAVHVLQGPFNSVLKIQEKILALLEFCRGKSHIIRKNVKRKCRFRISQF